MFGISLWGKPLTPLEAAVTLLFWVLCLLLFNRQRQ